MSLAKPAGRNADPNAHGKQSLGNRDQVAWVTRHLRVPLLFESTIASPPRRV
jgi:hypothetical protein